MAVLSHSKGCDQWLIVHVETRDEWYSLKADMLNFYIGNIGRGNDNNLINFAKNIKLCDADHLLNQRDAIQEDPERLETWALAYLIKFNKAKCKSCTWVWAIQEQIQAELRTDREQPWVEGTWGCW